MHGYSPIFRGARVLFFIRPRAGVGARRVLSSPSVSSSRTTPSPPRGAAKSRARDSRARDARRRVGRVEPPGDGAAAPDDAGRGEGEAAGRAAGRGQGAMGARPVPRRVDLLGPRRASPPPNAPPARPIRRPRFFSRVFPPVAPPARRRRDARDEGAPRRVAHLERVASFLHESRRHATSPSFSRPSRNKANDAFTRSSFVGRSPRYTRAPRSFASLVRL